MQNIFEDLKARNLRWVSTDQVYEQLSIPAGSSAAVCSIRTRVGSKLVPVLVFVGNAAQTIDTTFFSLRVDASDIYPYSNKNLQWAVPTRFSDVLPQPIVLGQNALVEIVARNAGAVADLATARIVIFNCEDLNLPEGGL